MSDLIPNKKGLIICPVGNPMSFHPAYDAGNHWRYTNQIERLYETLLVVYNDDYTPPPNTFDHILYMKGHKWEIIKKVPEVFDVTKYSYIGCVDDDLVTDIQSFNFGLVIANVYDFKLWQLSMIEGSGIIYDCLKQNRDLLFSETNFVEMGSPFFRQDMFHKAIDFLKELNFTVGWGIDKVFCDVLDCTANVVHLKSIYHPPNTIKPSYYDQREAMKEMNHMIQNVYPGIMKNKYNKPNWVFRDRQDTLNVVPLIK